MPAATLFCVVTDESAFHTPGRVRLDKSSAYPIGRAEDLERNRTAKAATPNDIDWNSHFGPRHQRVGEGVVYLERETARRRTTDRAGDVELCAAAGIADGERRGVSPGFQVGLKRESDAALPVTLNRAAFRVDREPVAGLRVATGVLNRDVEGQARGARVFNQERGRVFGGRQRLRGLDGGFGGRGSRAATGRQQNEQTAQENEL